LDAVKANDLVQALHHFGVCAEIDPTNKAVLYFGSDAAQRAYFSLRYTDPPAPEDKIGLWRHCALTLTVACHEAAPTDPVAAHNVGRFLDDDGEPSAAVEWYRRALALDRAQVESWGNLGTSLYTLGQVEEAERCWGKAIAFDANKASASVAQAYIWLRRGDYLRGWKALNQRWDDPTFASSYGRPDLPGKPWTGQPFRKGDTLLLHGEQGLGDHVMFARYARAAIDRGWPVVALETRPALTRWMEASLPGLKIVARGSGAYPHAVTYHVPLMSLPGLLGGDDLPDPMGPLTHAPRPMTEWSSATEPPGCGYSGTRRVGLVWKGTSGNPVDRLRSIPDELLGQLADIPGVTWVPLQYDPTGTSDLVARAWLGKSVEPSPVYPDVLGLAEAMAGLDMVVAVDTLGLHVAGSIGVPTLALHRFNLEWRWGQSPAFAPWYPSVTHLVQPAPGDWGPVLSQVRQCIETGTRVALDPQGSA
jgi:hypothetical protein